MDLSQPHERVGFAVTRSLTGIERHIDVKVAWVALPVLSVPARDASARDAVGKGSDAIVSNSRFKNSTERSTRRVSDCLLPITSS